MEDGYDLSSILGGRPRFLGGPSFLLGLGEGGVASKRFSARSRRRSVSFSECSLVWFFNFGIDGFLWRTMKNISDSSILMMHLI